jgi:exodeoxyribonuclease VII small subunit
MKKDSFEQGLEKLEGIVAALDDGDAGLEEALRLFAEGTKLAALLETRLAEAERTVLLAKNEAARRTNREEDLETLPDGDQAENGERTPAPTGTRPAPRTRRTPGNGDPPSLF